LDSFGKNDKKKIKSVPYFFGFFFHCQGDALIMTISG
jgi:hypothetical protein